MNARSPLDEIFERWCDSFQSRDSAAMKSLWDQTGELIYQSEEMDHAMFTWGEVDKYWDAIPSIVADIPEWTAINKSILETGDTALIYAKLSTRIDLVNGKRPLVGELRVTLGARLIGGEWKLTSLHESRHVDLTPYF